MDSKDALRRYYREIRKKIPDKDEKSSIITKKFINSDVYKNSEVIMLFYPMKNEVNTLFLLDRIIHDKKLAVFPVTDETKKEIIPFLYNKAFVRGAYGIYEPFSSEKISKDSIDTVIAPALSADKENFRLGYGGGYYDRFLKEYNGHKITFLFKELLCEKLICEKTDIKTDMVITD